MNPNAPQLVKQFSEPELQDAALQWMRANYGFMMDTDQDTYHARLGLLCHFIADLFPFNHEEQLPFQDAKKGDASRGA